MATILCITSGLTGILNASFKLAHRLNTAGYQCKIASPKNVKEKTEAQGLSFLQLKETNFDPAPELPDFRGAFVKLKRLFHKYANHGARREQALESLGMDTFMNLMERENPDLVIIDIELHDHIISLIRSRFKVLLLSQWFSTWKRKGLPPILSDITPGVGFSGSQLGLFLAWLTIDVKRNKIFFKKKLASAWTDRRSILQLYAKRLAFNKQYIPQNYWPGPFSYDLLPVISLTMKELDFKHDVRPNMEYVGLMVDKNRKELNEEKSIDFESLKKGGKKLMYCSVSTFKQGDTLFLKKIIEAVRSHKNWNLIISLGGHINTNEFSDVPNNVLLFKSVNQVKVLPQVDLSINHGGVHTINECIHFGVPMLVYSGKRSDQDGCAARVQYHGVGLTGDKDLDSIEEIRAKINQILSNTELLMKVKEIRKLNEKYNGKVELIVKELLAAKHKEIMNIGENNL